MKKGLVLEGGAMRGLFSAGVMDVLMERGVAFDGIIGVSAGAALAAAVKIGQRQEMKGKNIVVILPDAAERYLSTGLLD